MRRGEYTTISIADYVEKEKRKVSKNKKYTSVKNGGIQRRSPKWGGVYRALYKKVVTYKQ